MADEKTRVERLQEQCEEDVVIAETRNSQPLGTLAGVVLGVTLALFIVGCGSSTAASPTPSPSPSQSSIAARVLALKTYLGQVKPIADQLATTATSLPGAAKGMGAKPSAGWTAAASKLDAAAAQLGTEAASLGPHAALGSAVHAGRRSEGHQDCPVRRLEDGQPPQEGGQRQHHRVSRQGAAVHRPGAAICGGSEAHGKRPRIDYFAQLHTDAVRPN